MIGLRKIKNTIIFIVTVAILTMFCSCCKRSEIKLGSGNEGGIYYKFADTLSDIDENITNIRTAGSQANMRLLKDGFINMGIVQSDVLSEAVNGTGDFNGNKINNVRAVAALYMESFQIIVPADSDIQTPADRSGGTDKSYQQRNSIRGQDYHRASCTQGLPEKEGKGIARFSGYRKRPCHKNDKNRDKNSQHCACVRDTENG